jgi:hypothetical protein
MSDITGEEVIDSLKRDPVNNMPIRIKGETNVHRRAE